MENCDQESERRQVDALGLNLFLSRIYGLGGFYLSYQCLSNNDGFC